MANNYFISYDLVGPDADYEAVEEVIQKAGTARKVLVNFWYLSSISSVKLIKEKLSKVLKEDDKLAIVLADGADGVNISKDLIFILSKWNV